MFGTLGLTVRAYEWLKFELSRIPRDRQARFLAGMDDGFTQQLLTDPPVACWEPWSRETIHAILCLFDDDQSVLGLAVAQVKSLVAGTAEVLSVQKGVRLKAPNGLFIEPFGYADGISQPLFLKGDLPSGLPAGSFDPSAPLDLVLIPDPNGTGAYSHGSFLVYRKLEQDVAGFNQDVKDLATKIGANPDLAGAYAIGRFKDGTPVVLSDAPRGQRPPTTASSLPWTRRGAVVRSRPTSGKPTRAGTRSGPTRHRSRWSAAIVSSAGPSRSAHRREAIKRAYSSSATRVTSSISLSSSKALGRI